MEEANARDGAPLRIVLFSVLPLARWLAHAWAAQQGHAIPLVVTTPGPAERRGVLYREIVAQSEPEQDVLVTTRPGRAAAHVAALAPDLILSFFFPFRLPPRLLAVPRLGAVNLHPTPLPRYRGPNPQRMIYDGAPTVGATLHRMDDRFDHGPILGRHERAVADDASGEQITQAWVESMAAALTEGMARAAAGEPGEPQDEAQASYAARFVEADCWLDWRWPALTVQRRAIALNIFSIEARALIDGQPYGVADAAALGPSPAAATPGTVLARDGDTLVIQAGDGPVRIRALATQGAPGMG